MRQATEYVFQCLSEAQLLLNYHIHCFDSSLIPSHVNSSPACVYIQRAKPPTKNNGVIRAPDNMKPPS